MPSESLMLTPKANPPIYRYAENAAGILIQCVRLAANPHTLLLELQIAHKGPKLEHRCNWNYNGIIMYNAEAMLKSSPLNSFHSAPNMQEIHSSVNVPHISIMFPA